MGREVRNFCLALLVTEAVAFGTVKLVEHAYSKEVPIHPLEREVTPTRDGWTDEEKSAVVGSNYSRIRGEPGFILTDDWREQIPMISGTQPYDAFQPLPSASYSEKEK